MTLTEFLLARIDEDESLARGPVLPRPHLGRCGWRLGEELDDECACGYPARVLAECEVKRRLVNEFKSWSPWTLSVLALTYADHPDYQLVWKP